MQISVTDAKAQLTHHGHAAVRLVPVKPVPDKQARKALLQAVRAAAAGKLSDGPDAAHSQDFLYDDQGLPG